MKSIFKIYTLIFILILPFSILEFWYQKDSLLRRTRGDSVLKFFQARVGKVYARQELLNLGFSDLELIQLVSENRIVEIKVDSKYAGKNYQGDFYLLPRETLINEEFIQRLNPEVQTSGLVVKYFISPRTVESFKEDLEKTRRYWEKVYEQLKKRIGITGFEKFKNYFIPMVIYIIGDDLEMVHSVMLQTIRDLGLKWENLKDEEIQGSEEIDVEGEINRLLEERLEEIKEDMSSRRAYVQEHNIGEELSKIISSIKSVLEEYRDKILGIIIRGSWARLSPNEDSDLDLLIISEKGIDGGLVEELQNKIAEATGKCTEHRGLGPLLCQLIMKNPHTFQNNFGFDGRVSFPLQASYVRNFILIAKDKFTLDIISDRIIEICPFLKK